MLFNCHACKTPLFQAVEVDSMPIALEREPVPDGPIILMDADLTDRPRAIWGKPEDADWWRTLRQPGRGADPAGCSPLPQAQLPRERALIMEWKTRGGGRTELHVSTWAAYEHARKQPAGMQVKVYKRGATGWQLQETVTAGREVGRG